ncbi:MAG: bifunctional orotidine-5'-phosphate decarboxylase/orotate phosphoribosyltransferase [Anaerolineae bacterium]|nr:MAG: bifunctional orotidine-5'-phosphate decarboxylase/orotate phosphoribosyltransferase [Anaerolineae bacterium]
MTSFFSRLTDRAQAADSLLCVGLDPHPELLGDPSAAAARDFCLKLIEATADFACAFKPNSAFFEVFGAPGWAALGDVIARVPEEIPVILDAKRGDIASTARQYARAAFVSLGADALTVNPYLGHDAVEPFIEDRARGIFLLCKTSNPGSDDFQSLEEGGEAIYLHVARAAEQWNKKDNVGLVVGATDPVALAAVRSVAPRLWILAPGVGSQGGDLEVALRSGLRPDGLGMLIAVSRGIAAASSPREEAARLREAIHRVRSTHLDSSGGNTVSVLLTPAATHRVRPTYLQPGSRSAPTSGTLNQEQAALADAILGAGCARFGDFELKSGERSPIYFDLRLLAGHPKLLSRVAGAYLPILQRLTFDRLAAVPYAGLPIATAIALQSVRPLIYPRKEVKEYGTKATVEGGFEPGDIAVLIDDLTTSGGSKFEAVDKLTAAGLEVRDVVVLIDRQAGASEALLAAGLKLHSVFTLRQLIGHWTTSGILNEGMLAKLEEFLAREATG